MISSGTQGLLQITRKQAGFVSGSQHYEWRTASSILIVQEGQKKNTSTSQVFSLCSSKTKNEMRIRNKLWCYQGLKTQHLDKNYSRKEKDKHGYFNLKLWILSTTPLLKLLNFICYFCTYSSWFFSSKTNKIKKNFYVQCWKRNISLGFFEKNLGKTVHNKASNLNVHESGLF